jgi:CRISPR/Cas system-associated protein Cas10 (large subunit of type III CRISPR-Cas system)
MHLDKDILIKGNTVYSPNTSVYVPQFISGCIRSVRENKRKYPLGVEYVRDNRNNPYKSSIRYDKKIYHLGYYHTAEEAFYAYQKERMSHIKRVAEQYKGLIPNNLYKAMLAYPVEITD